jgi:two-component system cell cycle response regulator
LRILVAEDNIVSRRTLEKRLTKWGYEVVPATNGRDALQLLEKEDAPRLAILDWMMPELDGLEVCRHVRNRANGPYVYVILFTAKEGEKSLLEAMEAGADDYITKGASPEELRARLRAGRRIISLEERLVAVQEGLRVKATHDPLTGLWNHTAILDMLDQETARAKRKGTPCSIAMADLDHFKKVNDTHGHMAGDAILAEAAHRIESSVRPYDAVGRYGGEEFLIILPACNAPEASSVVERIRCEISNHLFSAWDAIIPVTISVGVATTETDSGAIDADAFIHAADVALYRAKAMGRNRVEVAQKGVGKDVEAGCRSFRKHGGGGI